MSVKCFFFKRPYLTGGGAISRYKLCHYFVRARAFITQRRRLPSAPQIECIDRFLGLDSLKGEFSLLLSQLFFYRNVIEPLFPNGNFAGLKITQLFMFYVLFLKSTELYKFLFVFKRET